MSFVLWVTETGHEWKAGGRLGRGHRPQAEKESMATQPVPWAGWF